ncbi:hypothetical protein A2U01_0110032, partial [Trifolium medium]|nr:hypothetical protein [Trifolium medium]
TTAAAKTPMKCGDDGGKDDGEGNDGRGDDGDSNNKHNTPLSH